MYNGIDKHRWPTILMLWAKKSFLGLELYTVKALKRYHLFEKVVSFFKFVLHI